MPRLLVSVSENRLSEVGLAIIDLDGGCDLTLISIVDSASYAKTINSLSQLFPPSELLLAKTTSDAPLRHTLASYLPEADMVFVARKYYNESQGEADVTRVAHETPGPEVLRKYLCLASVAALLKYVEFIQGVTFSERSLRVSYISGGPSSMYVDGGSLRSLEVISNNRQIGQQSLLGLLDSTHTTMGARMLRINLCQPPNDRPTISLRLDTVEELVQSRDGHEAIGEVLSLIGALELDRIIAHFGRIPKPQVGLGRAVAIGAAALAKMEANIERLVCLKLLLPLLARLRHLLGPFRSQLMEAMAPNIFDPDVVGGLAAEIDNHLDPARVGTRKKGPKVQRLCLVVRANIDALLDVSRVAHAEVMGDIQEYVQGLRSTDPTLGESLRLHHNRRKGFYLSLPLDRAQPSGRLAIELIKKQKNGWVFTTPHLCSLSERLKETEMEILVLSNRLLEQLLKTVRRFMPWFNRCAETIALLDMVWSLGKYSMSTPDVCKPMLVDDGVIAIQKGLHPVLQRFHPRPVVANSAILSEGHGGMKLLFVCGANNSGKSTYVATVCLLVLMAHIGCFVPAKLCRLTPLRGLHAQMLAEDSLESSSSTFHMEMRQCAGILSEIGAANCDPPSLVCFDELCRSTSNQEGKAMVWAVAEKLLGLNCLCLMVTHGHDVATTLTQRYPGVRLIQMLTATGDQGQIVPTFHAQQSSAPLPAGYGIKLGLVAGLPFRVIQEAVQLRRKLEELAASQSAAAPSQQLQANDGSVWLIRLAKRITDIVHKSSLSPAHQLELLNLIQSQTRSEYLQLVSREAGKFE